MLDTGKQTLVSPRNSESNRSEARRPRRLQHERLWKLITLGMEMEQTVPGHWTVRISFSEKGGTGKQGRN